MRRRGSPIVAFVAPCVFLLSAAGSLTHASSVKADEDPPASARGSSTEIQPPRLVAPVSAPYPDGAEGSSVVVVAVTVGSDGNVQSARVLEGFEPFASRALEAINAAHFYPATRHGEPIAATIRFRIDFAKAAAPPPDAPPPTAPAPTAPAPTAPATIETPSTPDPEQPGVVIVRGGKGSVGAPVADTLARTEVRQLPGAFGDPFRALEIAPGVTPIVSGLPYFYVRGAPPGNVGYFFDGVRVPYLFHFGLGPSVIQPALVSKTDVYKGGYPASLGRFAGGVVDATSMPPAADHIHGEADVRLLDAGGIAEAPFANGKGSALVGGRYSYTSGLFKLLDSKTSLDYRDYEARVTYALSDHDVLSLLVFGAYDHATERTTPDRETLEASGGTPSGISPTSQPQEITAVLFASEFHRADLRWDHSFGSGGHMRVATTIGFDRTKLEARRSAQDLMTGARLEIEQPIGKRVLVRGGADVVIDNYSADALPLFADDDAVVARQQKIFATRTDFATGVHADAVLLPFDHVEVTPGVRLDIYGSGPARAIGIDPRITARFFITDKVRIVHAYGLATQPPSSPIALPGVSIAYLEGGLQRSAQSSAGVEFDLPKDFSGSITGFHQLFYDLNDSLGTSQVEIEDIEKSDALVDKTRGSAYGLEVGLRRKLSNRIGGFLSYTLSRSERHNGTEDYLSSYDRTHVLNVAASVDLGRHWTAGARFVFYTGGPQYPAPPAYPGQIVGIPPSRTPNFYRLDLRVEKRWRVGEHGYIAAVFEALNATLDKETTDYRCARQLPIPGVVRDPPTCIPQQFGPVSVPSLGLEGGF